MKENNTFNEQMNPNGLPESLRVNPFDVPEGYFNTAERQIRAQVALPKPLKASEESALPADYFAKLEESIFTKIAEQDLRNQVASTGHTVPDTYFESLSERIMDAVKPQETPVRSIKRPQWTRYAVAATITAILGVGAYIGLHTTTNATANNMDLAAVSDQEIINYLAQSPVSEDIIYMAKYTDELTTSETGLGTQVQNEEIEEYLNYML
ncbi:hypothetical protein J5U18_03250 [Sphingobacteriaceae bacterium WQ 2009]|uniref:Uncharacterized protein n=1 Tax=Rhinopithecimicrobium faecis TaxID=2820698 RepID=A0A8T4H6W6_9SPHI|nr:hypothetical protein [Sphingobacteriaceae bacterium WQ 2009]